MLDAAVAEFGRHGFHAASMDEIAARAGVSKPMIYAYLGSKDALFVACMHREGTRLLEAIVSVVEFDLAPDEQLWRGMRAFFGYVAANRDGFSVLYRHARGPFAAEHTLMRARMIEVVTGMLARAAADRGLPARPGELAAFAYALVGAGESLADRLVDHPEATPDVTAGRLMSMVWLGAGHLLDGATWHPAVRTPPADVRPGPRDSGAIHRWHR
jgi:AcrR family transcriptional regulator